MRQRKVTMRHPKVKNRITVLESTVAVHMASGWQVVEPEPAPPVSAPDVEEASDKPAARRGRRTTTEPTTEES